MKIIILAMDDPLYTNNFIKQIIDGRKKDIVGFFYVFKGNRLTIRKGQGKPSYLFSLFLIMGPLNFIKNSFITIIHKVKIKLSKIIPFIPNPLVINYAKKQGVKTFEIANPNSDKAIDIIKKLKPDVIINQSQSIIKEKLFSIPEIGVINRHNALLPKNRGRLTPFWVLYKGEKETGVSIHFVQKGIDDGDIIIQKKYKVQNDDTFNSLVKKNYAIAGKAILEALDILESDDYSLIPNDNSLSTYNTTPDVKHAWGYRKDLGFKF